MSPGEDNFGIATNSKLTATFSEAMVPAAINTANFRLALEDNLSLPGTVSYDATNRIAVFTPTDGLLPGTRYTATVITGITDPAGNPLMSDFAWCFTTGADADFNPPSVTSTIPGAESGVAVNRKVSATFSEEMNSLTLTPANFKVTGPTGAAVSGKVTYLGGTAVFTPTNGLTSNTTYTATITAGARDLAGNSSQPMAWSFATGATADVAAPAVTSTNPAGAESGVAISRTINVSFNEPMNPATITTANFRVTGPGATPVIGTVAFDATSNTATFTRINHLTTPVDFHPDPVSNLEPNTTYTVTLTTGARDMAGNALAGNRVWRFTTTP